MKECKVIIPLGNITMRPGNKELNKLVEVLGRCEAISFSTARLTLDTVKIRICRTDVPEARGGTIKEIKDTVSGLQGDTLRLTYGETITIESIGSANVVLKVIKQ